MELFKQLSLIGLIPVIKVRDPADAVPLCRALKNGGLPVAEITFRTDAAEQAIRLVHDALPEVLLGAGTVLTTDQADRAHAAGASFFVSPGLNPAVVSHCIEKGYPVLPGCANPSDIETALSLGLQTVKFFPSEALGGLKMIKALSAPYGEMRFVPTGGINEKNLTDYLAFPKILACGGSWMVPEDAVAAKDWCRIEKLAADAVSRMLGIEIGRVVLNCGDEKTAREEGRKLSLLTGWPVLEENAEGLMIGSGFEVMKTPGHGLRGQIVLACQDAVRAKWHLEQRGFSFEEGSAVCASDGRLCSVVLKDEIAGFAILLVQKKAE